jgi:hypothetical protein
VVLGEREERGERRWGMGPCETREFVGVGGEWFREKTWIDLNVDR